MIKQVVKKVPPLLHTALFVRRIKISTSYYNYKYKEILKWLFSSRENTNFTYNLTPSNLRYLASFLSIITKKTYEECYAVINEPQADNELIDFIIKKTKALPYDQRMQADERVEFGKRLGWYAFVRLQKPKTVVETGIDKGLGAVLLCSALKKNAEEGFPGKYYGTDINPQAGYLLDGVYKNFGEILYGDSITSLKQLDAKIDIFINDSDHSKEYEEQEYETIKDKITADSILLGDNSHVTDKLSNFSIKHNRNFLFFQEKPENHWYPGGGIGVSFK